MRNFPLEIRYIFRRDWQSDEKVHKNLASLKTLQMSKNIFLQIFSVQMKKLMKSSGLIGENVISFFDKTVFFAV